MQCNTMQKNAMQCNAKMQFNTIQYISQSFKQLPGNPEQLNFRTMQYNAIQCNTMQYNTIQCNPMQQNAMQYNTKYNLNLLSNFQATQSSEGNKGNEGNGGNG